MVYLFYLLLKIIILKDNYKISIYLFKYFISDDLCKASLRCKD